MPNWMTIVLSIFTGIGIGTILSTFIRNHFEFKKFIYEQKLTKYCNLLNAYKDSTIEASFRNNQTFVSAQKQVELVGTDEILFECEKLYSTTDSHLTRDSLVKLMRKDLDNLWMAKN